MGAGDIYAPFGVDEDLLNAPGLDDFNGLLVRKQHLFNIDVSSSPIAIEIVDKNTWLEIFDFYFLYHAKSVNSRRTIIGNLNSPSFIS